MNGNHSTIAVTKSPIFASRVRSRAPLFFFPLSRLCVRDEMSWALLRVLNACFPVCTGKWRSRHPFVHGLCRISVPGVGFEYDESTYCFESLILSCLWLLSNIFAGGEYLTEEVVEHKVMWKYLLSEGVMRIFLKYFLADIECLQD